MTRFLAGLCFDVPRRRFAPLLLVLLGIAAAAGLVVVLGPWIAARLRPAGPTRPAQPDTAAAAGLDAKLIARLEPLVGDWLANWQETLPGFALDWLRRSGQDSLPAGDTGTDTAGLQLRTALGYIRLSPDRSRWVDINSYAVVMIENGDTNIYHEPDQLVELVDPRRRTRTRIAFHGTASSTETAIWPDDSTIVLLGSGENGEAPGTRLPALTVIRLAAGMRTAYQLPARPR